MGAGFQAGSVMGKGRCEMNRRVLAATLWLLSVVGLSLLPGARPSFATGYFLNEGPTLPSPADSITPAEVSNYPLLFVRRAGMQVFSTEFRSSVICYVPPGETMATPISDGNPPIDGFGDGCDENLEDPTGHSGNAGRPYLQNNGTFLRVNGLGSQSCLECHDLADSRVIPFTMGVGGHGGLNSTEIVFATEAASGMNGARAIIDVDDGGLNGHHNGYANFNGRIVNPPDTFGDGGVQLVAEEMTGQLQQERTDAINAASSATSGTATVALIYKSAPPSTAQVAFGSITCNRVISGNGGGKVTCDTSQVQGVNSDLVVEPFGRKGEFSTVRAFADNAFEFHSGMQPQEIDPGDPDADGVSDELSVAQLSALSVFLTTENAPVQAPISQTSDPAAYTGEHLFNSIGCAACHIPELDTTTTDLSLALPPSTNPVPFSQSAEVYRSVDLTLPPASFSSSGAGGIRVRMYSDLKRHYMGPMLCENAAFNDRAPEIPAEGAITGSDATNFNCMFITAKLWGVFDSAPYLHDGRALTLGNAIVMHAGEAASAAAAYEALPMYYQNDILAFLATLHNPTKPNGDVVP